MDQAMKDLTWILSSSDKTPDGRELTVGGVNTAFQFAISNLDDNASQDVMNMFVSAVLAGPRYVHEYECYKLVGAILRALVAKGANFPTEKMFEFRGGCVEEAVYDFPSRVALLFASGDNLNWTTGVESVCWEDVMDEGPTKELLTQCLKWHVENMNHMLLW